MKYIIVAFNARNSVYSFAKFLRNNNIQSNIINTPTSLSSSCGLSVKVSLSGYNFLMKLFKTRNIYNVIGVFVVERLGTQEKFEKIF